MYSYLKSYYFLFACFLILQTAINAQTLDIDFETLSIEDGLTFGNVYAIAQDSVGFLWFSTKHGLNRYDGYQFTQYLNIPSDPYSLSDNQVRYIFVDRSGVFWACTSNGLNKYDSALDRFIAFYHNPKDSNSLPSNSIKYIEQDKAGNYWLLASEGRLIKVNASLDTFTTVHPELMLHTDSSNPYVGGFHIDESDHIWLTINDRLGRHLCYLDLQTNHLTPVRYLPGDPGTPDILRYDVIYQDHAGQLWIGADGLVRINRKDSSVTTFKHKTSNPFSLSNNRINSIFEDHEGNFWIGTWIGLNKFEHSENRFYSLIVSRGCVWMIYEDNSGVLWAGTDENVLLKHQRENHQFPAPAYNKFCVSVIEDHNGIIWTGDAHGLHRIDRRNKQHTLFKAFPDKSVDTGENRVELVREESRERLWVGFRDGLYEFDRSKKMFKKFDKKQTGCNIPSHKNNNKAIDIEITDAKEDSSGNFWIGTVEGLYRYNKTSGELYLYLHNENDTGSLHHNFIRSLTIGKTGTVWVCAQDLHRYDPQTDSFKREFSDPHQLNGPGHSQVIVVHETDHGQSGTLWIGTEIGLFRYDRAKKTFKHYTTKDGLPHVHIRVLREDRHGNFWLPTLYGISKFDPQTEIFKNYNADDGLQGNYYYDMYQNARGELFASGRNGISVFHPDSIMDDPFVPPVIVTQVKIFNEQIKPDSAVWMKKKLILTHDQNMLSFSFAALDYTNPQKNQFAYRMKGFDKNWIQIGQQNNATYTNLSPGNYIFKVKGSNHDGVWDEKGVSLQIIILPPWWKRTWAYIVYIFIFVTAILAVRRFQINRLNMRHSLEMEHMKAEKFAEVDRLKSRFYTNISHEFRTPLTLILGPLEKLLSHVQDDTITRHLRIMKRNAQRLYQLINQLLDLSRLEAGRMKLNVRETNLNNLVNRCVQSFESQARLKNIRLQFESTQNEMSVYLDSEKIEDVCYNLISNALKFTPDGGEVHVSVDISNTDQPLPPSPADKEEVSQAVDNFKKALPSNLHNRIGPRNNSQFPIPKSLHAKITVSDTGPGIAHEKIERIFDRFYQVDESTTRKFEGSGIGLALSKELVELHRGRITASSKKAGQGTNTGTTITVYLPTGKSHFNEEEISSDEIVATPPADDFLQTAPLTAAGQRPERTDVEDRDHSLILVVEDNPDLIDYIKDSISDCYRIIQAGDGKAGFARAVAEIPDLVISDVMMPEMDGFELCRQLKKSEATSHIPVVLLTARADAESKITGLETGADDYLPKPFNIKELRIRIKNLIQQRQHLREKYTGLLTLNSSQAEWTSADERFLRRALDILEKHLSDSDLSVDKFGREIGLSRVQLHRKLRALTNLSATAFIRTMRLKHAAHLIKENYGSVAEIAYEVGFNNPSYFAECFRKQFGKTPSQYAD